MLAKIDKYEQNGLVNLSSSGNHKIIFRKPQNHLKKCGSTKQWKLQILFFDRKKVIKEEKPLKRKWKWLLKKKAWWREVDQSILFVFVNFRQHNPPAVWLPLILFQIHPLKTILKRFNQFFFRVSAEGRISRKRNMRKSIMGDMRRFTWLEWSSAPKRGMFFFFEWEKQQNRCKQWKRKTLHKKKDCFVFSFPVGFWSRSSRKLFIRLILTSLLG